jgi:hypothetical protein
VNNVDFILELTLFTVMLMVNTHSYVIPYIVLECERLQLVYSIENVAKSLCPLDRFFVFPLFEDPKTLTK